MKAPTLLLVTCCFAAPAFADADRCMNNLQRFDTETANPTAHQSATEASMFIEEARDAQARGDTEACVAASERALQALDRSYRQNGSGGSGGTGGGTGGGAN